MFPHDPANHLKQGLAGITAAWTALGVSFVEVIEQWLRIGSLAVGFAVGIFTLCNLYRGRKK